MLYKSRFEKLISSSRFHFIFLLAGFIVAVLYRNWIGSFGVSLGYFYILMILLSGLWFCLHGGITAALVAVVINMGEIAIYKHFPHRDLVIEGMLFRFSAYLVAGIVVGYFSQSEKKLKEKLGRLAHFDELTKCANHRFTLELLNREIARTRRYKKPLCVLIMDIDHFKTINDTHGHISGNEALKYFATTLKNSLREVDVAGRYGGDEFLAILPDTGIDQAIAVSKRIHQNLSSVQIPFFESHGIGHYSITFSGGIATFPEHAQTVEDLLKAADNALYLAKKAGRNQTCVERRREKRLPPSEKIQVSCRPASEDTRPFYSNVINISPHGMLVSSFDKTTHDNLFCRIVLPEQKSSKPEFLCHVVRKHQRSDGRYDLGLSFSGVPAELDETFQLLVATQTA